MNKMRKKKCILLYEFLLQRMCCTFSNNPELCYRKSAKQSTGAAKSLMKKCKKDFSFLYRASLGCPNVSSIRLKKVKTVDLVLQDALF